MTIDELIAADAPRWILEGPNSGGVSGVYYWRGTVYCFSEELGGSSLGHDMPVDMYLRGNEKSEDVRVREAVEAISQLVNEGRTP